MTTLLRRASPPVVLVVSLAQLVSCRHSTSQSPVRTDPRTSPPPAALARPILPTADAGVANLDRIKRAASPEQAGPPLPAGIGRLLLPGAPGVTRSETSGCLAAAAHDESAGQRFPVPAPTRGPAGAPVRLSSTGNGIVVVHDLDHACCLQSRVEGRVEGQTVRIVETLGGQPCRCLCQSTIRTAVGLSPGQYQVVVTLVEPGRKRDVFEQAVEVKHLRP